MLETEHKKRRSRQFNKVERAKDEYGAALTESDGEESPTVVEKREAYETEQRTLERIDAAWDAGAKARHIAAEEEAERLKQERALRMFNTVDAALSKLEQLAAALDEKAAEVGELAAQVQGARSEFFGSLAGLPFADRETLASSGQWLLRADRVQKLFTSVADSNTHYQLRAEYAVGENTADQAAQLRHQAASIAGVDLEGVEEEVPGEVEEERGSPTLKVNPADFGAVAHENGFWMPGVKLRPNRVPHELPPWSRPAPAMPAGMDEE